MAAMAGRGALARSRTKPRERRQRKEHAMANGAAEPSPPGVVREEAELKVQLDAEVSKQTKQTKQSL